MALVPWTQHQTGNQKIAPTQGSLYEHIRRAHYQCLIWRQALISHPNIVSPCELGWSTSDTSGFFPKLTSIPLAPDSILQLVRCKCSKSQCNGRCSCRENKMPCTELCNCDPDGCKNLVDGHDVSDESDTN